MGKSGWIPPAEQCRKLGTQLLRLFETPIFCEIELQRPVHGTRNVTAFTVQRFDLACKPLRGSRIQHRQLPVFDACPELLAGDLQFMMTLQLGER